jgi:methyl-accepting chemotaxis protein
MADEGAGRILRPLFSSTHPMEASLKHVHSAADRIMLGVALCLFVLSLALAPWYGTWELALTIGIGLTSASAIAVLLFPARRFTSLVNAVAFMGFTALLIQQAHGMIEMHFVIFGLLAFLLYYRDWLPLVVGAGVVAAHHLVFCILQAQGAPVFIFNHMASLTMVAVHSAFVVFETGLLVYMAILSRREALDAEEVSALGSRIGEDGSIDLSMVKGATAGKSTQRIEAFLGLIGSAVAGTRTVAADVHSASQSLAEVTKQIRVNAQETSAQADLASAAADEVSMNISVVAKASEEMLTSMYAISTSANQAAQVAKKAVDVAYAAHQTVGKLGDSSSEIGKFVKVIASIAEQTNLLALNATIEAARAGEAGKGFAVVASAVKELAKATAKATAEIAKKIETIQSDTRGAVAAIGEITAIIRQVDDISSTIAAAVEEQTASTNQIGRNVGDAAKGASEIAANIANVATAAQNTTSDARDTQEASRALAETASQLEVLVGRFKLHPQSDAGSQAETLATRSAVAGS